MVSSAEYDEYVKKHCGRMSLLEQAKTGYTNMGQFEEAYTDLYKNPEVQRKFGVEELAYVKTTKGGILNQMMQDQKISEGSINFGNGINPPIEEGVFVRNNTLFKDGVYKPPTMDSSTGADMDLVNEFFARQQREQTEAQRAENRIVSRELKENLKGGLESMMEDMYKHQLERRGGTGKMDLSTKTPETGASVRYTKYGLISASVFNNMEIQAQIDYLTKEFFDGNTAGLLEYSMDERKYDYVVQQRREEMGEFADLQRREEAIMEMQRQGGMGASGSGTQPEPEPKGDDPESPRSAGGFGAFSVPESRFTGN
tara:strand:- start:1958 stop:2896 length:939 start_codon:yes stop_codon:yes gene_type:complete